VVIAGKAKGSGRDAITPGGGCSGQARMKFPKGLLGGRFRTAALAVAALAVAALVVIVVTESDKPLPDEPAEAVAEKFYEYISQARIRGGTLLIREAYKLIDNERSRLSEARFTEIVQKYPTGFRVEIVNAEIVERHAEVTVEYRLPSMFGDGYTVSNVIALNVDEATNTWKLDFTGETDSQDLAAVKESAK
jgi:hypothetical protein